MKCRILKNANGRFRAQYRKQLFWRNLVAERRLRLHSVFIRLTFPTFDKAHEALEEFAAEQVRARKAQQWSVYKELKI